MDMMTKTFALTTRSPAGMHELEADIVLSTADEDREGDVISARGWQLDNYKRCPVVLLNHDAKGLPVARAENVQVVGDRLTARLRFPPPGVSARADEARQLLKNDILIGCSVGFKPIKAEPRKGGGTFFREQELLELSLVSVAANPEARVFAKGGDGEWLVLDDEIFATKSPRSECPRRPCEYNSLQFRCDARWETCPYTIGIPRKSADPVADLAALFEGMTRAEVRDVWQEAMAGAQPQIRREIDAAVVIAKRALSGRYA